MLALARPPAEDAAAFDVAGGAIRFVRMGATKAKEELHKALDPSQVASMAKILDHFEDTLSTKGKVSFRVIH